MTPTPQERYRSDLAAGVIVADEAQAQAVDALQDVFDRLNQRRTEKKSFIAKLFDNKAKASVQGLYMWGGVGRGVHEALAFCTRVLPRHGPAGGGRAAAG